MQLTKESLRSLQCQRGKLTKQQLILLGESFPPPLGWFKRNVNREIPVELFFALAQIKYNYLASIKHLKQYRRRIGKAPFKRIRPPQDESMFREAEKFADEAYSRGELS